MAKPRRLEDLYVLGREVKVSDDQGEPVVVWLQKINPVEHETCLRKASAAKARVLASLKDHDSDDYQAAYADVMEFGGRDALIEYLIVTDLDQFRESREAELGAKEEWAKDDYLQGLKESWLDGLQDTWIQRDIDPEDPKTVEAVRVFEELQRFDAAVAVEVDAEHERLKRDYETVDDDEVTKRVMNRFTEVRAGLAWVREYRRWELFYSTREPTDHKKRYFESREQMDLLDTRIMMALINAYQELTVDPLEGKDLPSSPNSSASSEQQDGGETALLFGPEVVGL